MNELYFDDEPFTQEDFDPWVQKWDLWGLSTSLEAGLEKEKEE